MEKITILDCPVWYDKTSMLDMLSLAAGRAFLCQNRMGEMIVGDSDWGLDPMKGLIRFGKQEFTAGILGTESEIQNTWLWSWAHTESGLPEKSTAISRRAKRNLPDLPEFQTGKFMLDELHNGHDLAMICVGVSPDNVCYYRCPYDGGAAFVEIHGLPEEIFAQADDKEFLRQYIQIISGFYCDHRLLAAGFLHQNGTAFTFDESVITAEFGTRKIRLTFERTEDDISRVMDISEV